MPELLLELFSEEIPARMQGRAAADLKQMLTDALVQAGLVYEGARAHATPRRLVLSVSGIPAATPDTTEERKGPRVDAPAPAIQGFLRSVGVSLEDCVVQEDKKGSFYIARIARKGRTAEEVIAAAVPDIVRRFPWPKSMRWGAGTLRWVRPLHSILCTFDGEPVAFEIEGIRSGNETRGHRFMAPQAITARRFEDYETKLRAAFVMVDEAERADTIRTDANTIAFARGLELVEDPGLLTETAGLVEWPVVLMGEFDPKFLELPPEVIATSIKTHQKCFALTERDSGRLSNHYILVSNLVAKDGGAQIVAGNNRVIAARLSDARFFWDQDRKVALEDRLPALSEITFHARLGTQRERVERIERLAGEIAGLIGADPEKAMLAARLAKADLVTGMVGEFPELQGVMGRYYALAEGLDPEVADAIRDHYKPQGPSDSVPASLVGQAVALADKIDTLVGFWAIDEKPTGSKDPYALRRAALGITRILIESHVRLKLRGLFTTQLESVFSAFDSTGLENFVYNYSGGGGPLTENVDQFILDLTALMPLVWSNWFETESQIDKLKTQLKKPNFERSYSNLDFKDAIFRAIDCADTIVSFRLKRVPLPGVYVKIRDEILSKGYSGEDRVEAYLDSLESNLLSFFADRLKVYLRDQGARHDLIDAVFSLGGQDDLLMIVRRVEALGKFLDTEDGRNLLAGVKRATNIIRIEEKKDGRSYDGAPDKNLLLQAEERALATAIDRAAAQAQNAVEDEDFEAAMRAMAKLRAPVDDFFDKVTVNADDPSFRENRLKLLSRIRAATLTVADFSKIEG